MQEKESEAVQAQRRRRKRIARIKNTIIAVIAGWILLSMLLIICLFVKVAFLENKVKYLTAVSSAAMENTNGLQNGASPTEAQEPAGTEGEPDSELETVEPPKIGIDDEENLAEADDIHKIYLTFDDGPSENTEEILDILAEYGVKASFFVTGQEGEEAEALYRRIAEEGHTLAMHSYSNKYSLIYQSEEAFQEDYQKLYDYLYDVTGVQCRYYRFPGGSSNQISNVPMNQLIHFLNSRQIVYYDWNVSAGDAASTAYSADEIVEKVTQDVVKYKTSVVLLHDGADKSATVEALGPLIEALQAMNAEILPIDEDTQVIQYVKADSVE
ncbi:MAG: polysaccharide deacetylase [Roseburia sp.]|nr:polysaccharide deacetylase [Roseburia sp.]